MKLKNIDERIKYSENNSDVQDDQLLSYLLQHPNGGKQQIIIPPGQSVSEEFIIPIDDFVADRFSKSFEVSLLKTGNKINRQQYTIDRLHDKATIDIENNDKAGLLLIYPGNAIRVSEDDSGAAVLVALTSQPTDPVTIKYDEIFDFGVTPKQLNNSATLTFTSDDWFVPKPLAISAIQDNVIEDRIAGTHELVRYENITSPLNPNEVIDTIPYRNQRIYTNQFSSIEKLLVDESELDNTGYHPAKIKFKVESCDDDYANLSVNQTESIEVIDAELPDESIESILESFDTLQDSVSDIPNPMSDGFDDDETSETFEFATDLEENLDQLPYKTPSAVNHQIESDYSDASLSETLPSSRALQQHKSQIKNFKNNGKTKNLRASSEEGNSFIVKYDLDAGRIIINDIYDKKDQEYKLNLLNTSIGIEGESQYDYTLTTSAKPSLKPRDKDDESLHVSATLNAVDRANLLDLEERAKDLGKDLKFKFNVDPSTDDPSNLPVNPQDPRSSVKISKLRQINSSIKARNTSALQIDRPDGSNANDMANTFWIKTGILCKDGQPTYNTLFRWEGKQLLGRVLILIL